jgi:hypothetical protein
MLWYYMSPALVPQTIHYCYNIHILILSSHLCLDLQRGFLPSSFLTTILDTFIISPMHAICFVYLLLLDLITLVISGEQYKLWSTSLCYFHSPLWVAPYSTLFSNTLNILWHIRFSLVTWSMHHIAFPW